MLEQNCGCSVDHQEEIIGICLSDKCVNNAQFCYNCLRQFHYEHQKQCQTFKNLFNQLVEDKKQLQIYVNYVKQFKVIFDEIYRKQLEKSQENIEKLNSINLRIKEKSFYPTDSDIHFLRNYKSSQQYFQQWIAKLEWIEKQVYNQKDYQDQDQNKTDQQTIDKTQNQKRATEPDLTDGQTIDQNQNQKNTDVVVQQGIDLFNNKQFQKALVIFEKFPNSHKEAINWKMQCLLQMKKYRDVVEECDKILQSDTQSFEIYLNKSIKITNNIQGEALIELKEFSLAISNIQKGIELNPQGVIQLIQQKQNLFNSENLDQLDASNLKDIINQAKQINQENQSKLQLLNKIEDLPDYLTAQLQQKNQTQSLEESHNLADDKKQEKQYEIENTFNSCLEQLNKIISDYQDGKIQKEIKQNMHQQLDQNSNCQDNICKDETLISELFIQGINQLNLSQYEDAINSFQTVLKLDHNQHKAYALKGQALHSLKRFKEAITQFDLALFIYQDVSYLIKKADSLLELHEYQDAVATYEDALLAGTEDAAYIDEKLKSIQIK